MKRLSKRRVMMLSLAAALITLALKAWAYWLTGSIALLSDAAETLINLTAAIITLIALEFASRPADATHTYGHEKAEYFSSGVEGTLILAAAVGITYAAYDRLTNPMPLGDVPIGLIVAAAAGLVNFLVAQALLKTAKAQGSISLEAHAKHLLTDVWTTSGVIAALAITSITHLYWLDPIVAAAVALHIVIIGVDLLRRSMSGLLDRALPAAEIKVIEGILNSHTGKQAAFHNLRTRQAGTTRFIDFHLLVPGERNVQETHDLCEVIEAEIRSSLDRAANITIHIEPLEDPAAWEDANDFSAH